VAGFIPALVYMVSHTFFVIARLAKPAEAISGREILNPKHQVPNEIQKSKFKDQNDNLKCKNFDLCFVTLHFYFYFLHFSGICLEIGFWDLEFSQRDCQAPACLLAV
jgi:hypothetical protein